MIRNCFYFFSLIILLISCNTQKRLNSASQKTYQVRQDIAKDSVRLDAVQQKIAEQGSREAFDTTLEHKIQEITSRLQADLKKIEETVHTVELLSQNKSHFNKRAYNSVTKPYLNTLDSFQAKTRLRNRIYQLLTDAVNMGAFHKYPMGTFFDPGAYKISPEAIGRISRPFQPAIDSLIKQSNDYADISHTAYIVLVGYADEQPITPGTPLYKELKSHLPEVQNPTREQLNLMLSDLRANELLRNMKIIVQNSAAKFVNYSQPKIAYISYGRGEAFPFKNITDYQQNDERRRVVVFYWSVLPVIE